MFEQDLANKLKEIFDLKKVTFDQPGKKPEQECLFVQVERVRARNSDGKFLGRVEAQAYLFANTDKIPFGYFQKQIALKPDLCRDIFFEVIEENSPTYRNIAQRSMRIVYFFNFQYDPEIGTIEQIQTFEVNP